jgi:hypothetical protein
MELNLKNLPRVAVHDIIVHPRDNDLILGNARAKHLRL